MADKQAIIEALKQVPLFKDLSNRHLTKFANRFSTRDFAKDEVIFEQGSSGIGLYIIASGQVHIIRTDDGEQTQLEDLGVNDFFGELSLLVDAPRTASAVAVEPTTCLMLRKLDFLGELDEEPEIALPMLKEIAQRFSAVFNKI